ncbi:glycosyltransferase [Bacillus sp. GX]|uniref:glycosyltransferase n=1 Tax=Bacillus sp. GX TaxID=3382157 RepID=UPI00065B4EEE|nr:hypothetical protein TU52_16400 [Bacillus cereus]
MKSVLFVTTLLPFPLDNGGKIKTYNTIKALAKNYEVDLISYVNIEEDKKHLSSLEKITTSSQVIQKNLIRSTSFKYFLKDYIKSLFTAYPYSINKFYSKELEEIIIEKLEKRQYEYIYIDHLPMMVYSGIFKQKNVILDQHNVENVIFKRFIETEKNPIKKILGFIEYKKLKNFEMKAMEKVNQIICLSNEDKISFEKLGISPNSLNVLPIHMDITKNYQCKLKKDSKVRLLFLGSMSWYPNQNGIQWFMEEVWNKLNKDYYELYIVGSNPSEDIKRYNNDDNVFVTGYVDDVDEYIEKCDVSIVPLFVGSGQRVKIIESFAKKIPVLSTSIGAEGLIYKNKKDIILADNAMEFIDSLEELRNQPEKLLRISESANMNFQQNYSADYLPDKLKKIMEKCKG